MRTIQVRRACPPRRTCTRWLTRQQAVESALRGTCAARASASIARTAQAPRAATSHLAQGTRSGLTELRGADTQAVLAIALVVVVFRINLYHLALPGGGGVASRHAAFPAQAETVHTGASLAAIRTHAAVKSVACAARIIQSLKPLPSRLAEGGTSSDPPSDGLPLATMPVCSNRRCGSHTDPNPNLVWAPDTGATPEVVRKTLRPAAHGKKAQTDDALEPCDGACPCITHNRHHVVSCPCWEHKCLWSAPTPATYVTPAQSHQGSAVLIAPTLNVQPKRFRTLTVFTVFYVSLAPHAPRRAETLRDTKGS
jgi:hypothetical protein